MCLREPFFWSLELFIPFLSLRFIYLRMDSSVFRKINFSTKKLRAYLHASLQGIYNSDPKAFLHGTSLKGPSTW